MSIYAINLNEFNDRTLAKAVNEVPQNSVILFEDIDCMSSGKARVAAGEWTSSRNLTGADEKDTISAMMGVTLNLLKEGAISTVELNRMAGFLTNPCDLVGVAVLISAGTRCRSVVRPAIAGAAFGILLRGVLHLIWF